MADSTRGFAVNLSANTLQYEQAMKRAEVATTSFTATTHASMQKLGGKMEQVGGLLTRSVTVPIVAAGVGALKLAADWDQAFGRMVGLAGITADSVDGLKDSVLSLSGKTGQAPAQLADALYFASSAGLDTEHALQAVERAATASAAGMGKAKDVVGLVASALASYGAENITAARATDILTASIKVGRADPEELAGSLGRVLPIAAQLGVSFEEVGGATAYLSNIFGDTNRTVTSLQGVLVKLVQPSKQGSDALSDMGTSVEELHAAIDQRGLMGALDLLKSKGFGDNQQALRALFDDVEAFQGALALMNDKSGTLVSTMGAVKDSVGLTDDAFKTASQTGAFQLKKAWAEIQVALIQAGEIILPVVAGVAGAIGELAEKFAGLPKFAQMAVIGILGIVATVGPVVSAVGKILKNIDDIGAGLSKMAAFAAANPVVAIGLGVAAVGGAVALAMLSMDSESEKAAKRATEFYAAIKAGLGTLDQQRVALDDSTQAVTEFADAVYADADKKLRDSITGNKEYVKVLQQLGLSLDDVMVVNRGGAQAEDLLTTARRKAVETGQIYIQNQSGQVAQVASLTTANTQLRTATEQYIATGQIAVVNTFAQQRGAAELITKLEQQTGASYDSAQAAADLVRIGDQQAYVYLKTTGQLGLLTSAEQHDAEARLDRASVIQTETDRLTAQAAAYHAAPDAVYDAARATGAYSDRLTALAASYGELPMTTHQMEQATKDAEQAVKDATDALNAQVTALEADLKAQMAIVEFARGSADAQIALQASTDEYSRALEELPGKLTEIGKSKDSDAEKQRQINALYADGTKAAIAMADDTVAAFQEASGGTLTASQMLDIWNNQALANAATASGPLRQGILDYIATTNDIPTNIATYIAALIDQGKLDEAAALLESTSATRTADVQAEADQASISETNKQIQDGVDGVTASVEVDADTTLADRGLRAAASRWAALGATFHVTTVNAAPHTSAEGRYVDRPMFSSLGEGGRAEVVLPLTNAGRMRALMGDQRVWGPIMAAMGGRQSADGRVVNISHTTIPAALPASVSAGSATQPANDDELMARKFERGLISAQQYDAYLAVQQSHEEQFSDRENRLYEIREGIKRDQIAATAQAAKEAAQAAADAAKEAADQAAAREKAAQDSADAEAARLEAEQVAKDAAIAREDARMQWLYDHQQISYGQYIEYLGGKLAGEEVFSQGWIAIHAKMDQMRADETAKVAKDTQDQIDDQTRRWASMFNLMRLQQDLNDAIREQAETYQDLQDKAGAAFFTAMDPNSSAADKASTLAAYQSALRPAARAVIAGADARANAEGLLDNTPEWAVFMRSAITGWIPGHDDLAPFLNEFLSTLPSFAAGGYMPATPGGAIVRVAEGGKGEWMIPDDKMRSASSGWGGGGTVVHQYQITVEAPPTYDAARGARDLVEQIDRHLIRNGVAPISTRG